MTTIQQAIFLDGGPGQIDYWFNQLTDTNANSTTGYSLTDHAFDSLGNIVVAGISVNNTWPDNKHFWHKIGKNGDILVTRTFSDSNSGSDVTDIAIDSSDNIYAALGNARFVKWDSSNNIVYSKRNTWSSSNQPYGDSGVGGGSLTLSGNALSYYSLGSNRRAMQVDASTGEIYSATTASAGNTFFGKGGFGKTSQGNFLCGYVQGPGSNYDNYWMVATTSLSQQFCFYSGSTAAICRGIDYINGNYYIVGMRQTDNSFAGDALMYKLGSYSSSGNQGILWSRRIRNINNTSNGSYQSQFYDVAGDSEGNIYTVGHSPEPSTVTGGIIIKFNSSGTIVWSRFIKHSSGSTYVTKITIDSNDTMWVNIDVKGSSTGSSDVCGVAKLPTSGLFIGTYCGFTVTDWSSGFNSSYQSFNHNAQSGSVPGFLGGYGNLTLGDSFNVSYTEPTVPGSSGQCKSMVASTTDPGQESFTTPGTYQWTAPAGITKVSVVAVGGGGGGQSSAQASNGVSSCGGAGGGLGWKNNIPVTPGQVYTVVVGAGGDGQSSGSGSGKNGSTSYFIDQGTVEGGGGNSATSSSSSNGGGFTGDGGGNGGKGNIGAGYAGGGGGGAGGYSGDGGDAVQSSPNGNGNPGTPGNDGQGGAGGSGGGGVTGNNASFDACGAGGGGGGVGILGEGASGAGGEGGRTDVSTGYGSGGNGGSGGQVGTSVGLGYQGQRIGSTYGAGGGGGGSQFSSPPYHWYNGADGGHGAVRIIWGAGRLFPSTNTGDV